MPCGCRARWSRARLLSDPIQSDSEYGERFSGLDGSQVLDRLQKLGAYDVLGLLEPDDCSDGDVAKAFGKRTEFWRNKSARVGQYIGAIRSEIDRAKKRLESQAARSQYRGEEQAKNDAWMRDYLDMLPSGGTIDGSKVQKIQAMAARAGINPVEADRALKKVSEELGIHLEGQPERPKTRQTTTQQAQSDGQPLDWMRKFQQLRTIPAQYWRRDQIGWSLSHEYTSLYFSGYAEVRQDTDPVTGPLSMVWFQCQDGRGELTLFSRQRPEEYYELLVAPGNSRQQVYRYQAGRVAGTAELMVMAAGLTLACPEIEEHIQVNLALFQRMDAESRRDRQMRMMPWRRLLSWMGRLQTLDPAGFARLPGPLRGGLQGPRFEQAIAELSDEKINELIQRGVLPAELENVPPEQVQFTLSSIRGQQNMLAQRPEPSGFLAKMVSSLTNPAPPVPAILAKIDPQHLDLVDLQVLVTLGALRPMEGIWEREMRKLLARRPELQAMANSPEGQSAVWNDYEVLQLRNNPQVVKEMQEQAWRQAGMTGPTPAEQAESINRSMVMATFFGVAFDPGGNLFERKVPWKIYQYLKR